MVDVLNIISFKNKLQQIRETRMGFFMSLTCCLITVEATAGKEPSKELCTHDCEQSPYSC